MSDQASKVSGEIQPGPPAPSGGVPPGFGVRLRQSIRTAFVENAALKFVALVLALTVFVLVHSDENEVYHPWVRVTYSQQEARVLVSKRVDQVQISVRGSRRRLRRLQKSRLDNIHIDLDKLSSGDLRLEPEMFDLPDGVELISVNPPSIYLEFDDRIEKMLPVNVDTVGVPARGFTLGALAASPSSVRVGGARQVLGEMSAIMTEKVNLTGRTQSFQGPVALVAGDIEVMGAPDVVVSVQIIEELQARKTGAKSIVIRAPAGLEAEAKQYVAEPTKVEVTMYGPVHALEAIDASRIEVFVDLLPADLIGRVNRPAELKVEPSLSDIAYKIAPTKVMLKSVP